MKACTKQILQNQKNKSKKFKRVSVLNTKIYFLYRTKKTKTALKNFRFAWNNTNLVSNCNRCNVYSITYATKQTRHCGKNKIFKVIKREVLFDFVIKTTADTFFGLLYVPKILF